MFKKITFIFLCALITYALVSCTPGSPLTNNTNETNSTDSSTSEDVYYVKYASNGLSNSNYYNVTYTTEDGNSTRLSSIPGGDFERTIGPVSEGFKSEVTIECNASYPTTIAVRIEVKKNDNPFTVKKETVRAGTGYVTSSVTYTIE